MDRNIPNGDAGKTSIEPTSNDSIESNTTNGPVLEKEDVASKPAESPEEKEDESQYPHGLKLWMILMSLYIAMFLVALVSIPYPLVLCHNGLIHHTGSTNHRQRHPKNHR
jgi:hypothetical protein